MLKINEQQVSHEDVQTIGELATIHKPLADLFILNGYPVSSTAIVHDGDVCTLIVKGEIPTPEEMINLLQYQKGFEASAKFLATVDEMMSVLLTLKR